jgi:hypothetical protein
MPVQSLSNLSSAFRTTKPIFLSIFLLIVCSFSARSQVQFNAGTSTWEGTSGRVMIGQPFRQITQDCEAVEVQGGLLGHISPFSSVSLTAKTDTFYLDVNGEAIVRAIDLDGGSMDSCGQLNIFLTDSLLSCADLGQQEWVLYGFSGSDSVVVSDTTTITVLDTVPPGMICQDLEVTLNVNNEAEITVTQVDGGTTDNCQLDSLWLDRYAFDCADLGQLGVTLFARDSSGNTSSCTAQVMVEQNNSPVAVCRDVTVYLAINGQATITPEQIDNGSYNGCDPNDFSLSQNTFSCGDIGVNDITLTVSNQQNEEATCTALVTVLDTISPSVETDPVVMTLNSQGQAILEPDDFREVVGPYTTDVFVYSDNRIAILRNNAPGISGSHSGYYLSRNGMDYYRLVHTGSDNSWHYFRFSPYVSAGTVFGSTGTHTFALYQNRGFSDNCSTPDIALSQTTFTCADLGPQMVTLTATDENGNATMVTEQVTIEDHLEPTVLTSDITISLDQSFSATITAEDIDNGSYDNCSIVTRSLDRTTFSCADIGDQTVILTITDQSGNSAQASATVHVADALPPVANARDTVLYLDKNGQAFLTAEEVEDGSTDNCFLVIMPGVGELSFELGQTEFGGVDVGLLSVPFVAIDAYGNRDTSLIQVDVRDTIPPVAVCQPISIFLDDQGTAEVLAGQIDGGSTDQTGITDRAIALDQGLMGTPAFDSTLSLNCTQAESAIPVLLRVTDPGGNVRTCQSTITVLDTTAPLITDPNLVVELDPFSGNHTLTGNDVSGMVTDNCSVDTIFMVPDILDCSDIGMVSVALIAIDGSNNRDTLPITVVVNSAETIPPVVITRPDTLYLNSGGQTILSTSQIDGGTYDACSGLGDLSLSQSQFDCTHVGLNEVYLYAEDLNGNMDSAIALVTVLDTLAPDVPVRDLSYTLNTNGQAFLAEADLTRREGPFQTIVATYPYNLIAVLHNNYPSANPAVVDGWYASVNGSEKHQVFLAFADQFYHYYHVGTDGYSGQPVTDDLFPNTGGQSTIQFFENQGPQDQCSEVSISFSQDTFSCADTGQNQVTVTGADASGNETTHHITVTIQDEQAPTIRLQSTTVYLDANGQGQLLFSDIDDDSFDNCAIDSTSLSSSLFSCSDLPGAAVTVELFDPSGNRTQSQINITIADTVAPVITCQPLTVYLDESGQANREAEDFVLQTSDACGMVSLSLNTYTYSCETVGEQPVTVTATDPSGNTSTCQTTVTVVDTISPALACQDLTVYLDGTGSYELSLEEVLVSAEDACGVEEINLTGLTRYTCAMPPVTVDIEVLDVHGNASYCRSQITVLDTIPPAQVCRDTTVYLDENGIYDLSLEDVLGNVQDACGIDTIDMYTPVETLVCASPPVEVEVWATDHSGNTTNCVSTVTVLDTVVPQAVCRDAIAYLDRNGGVTITPDLLDNGSTDACGISMLELDQTNFSCTDVGEQIVTLTATDPNGNATSCTATVTVSDTIAPEVTAKTFLYLDLTPDTAYLSPDQVIETVFEACGQDSVWLSKSLFTEQDTGLQWVQWYVRDVSGNITTDSVEVHVVAPMVLATELTHESCFESNDGAIDLSVRAGVPPYRYLWSTGAVTTDLANLEADTYTVTVTDTRDHTATETVEITQPLPLTLNLVTQDASCFSESDGFIFTSVQGGTEPYSYLWNTGAETSALANIPAGNYGLTVTDANQCQVFADTSIAEPADFSVEPVADVGPVCNDTPVRVQFGSDAPEATFTWTNTNPAIGLSAAGQGTIDFAARNETNFAQTGTIVVTPHFNGCTGNPDTFQIIVACPAVAGQVRWYRTGAGLAGVAIEQMGDATKETQSNAGGTYQLPAQPGLHFRNHPSFPELTLTGGELATYGIDEQDAQRLQEHLDGGTPLQGYDLLAGDINDNGQLSSADLVLMQYALQGFEEPLQFFEREAWKFVDANMQVVDSLMFDYSDTLTIDNRHGQVSGVSWLGVRKGDLTGSNGSLDYDPVIATSPSPLDPVDARTDAPGLSLAILSDQMTATCGDVFEAIVIAQDVSGGDSISLLTLDAGVHWAADELLLLEATAGHFRSGEANVFTAAAMGQVSLAWKDLVDGGVPVVQGDTLLTLTFEVLQTPGLSTLELGPTPGTQPAGALSYLVGFQYSENWESMPAQVEFVPETTDFELNRVSSYTVETIDVPNTVCVDATTVPVQVSFQQMAGEAPTHYSIDFFAEAESMGLTDRAHVTLPNSGLIDLLLPTDLPEGTIAFELSVGDGGDCYSEPLAASLDVVAAPEVVLTGLPEIICAETTINVEALLDQPEQYGYAWQICSEYGDNCQSLNGSTAQVSFAVAEAGDYELVLTVSGGDCGDLTVRKSFSVQQIPVVTYPLEDDELVYCQGTEVYLAFTADLPGTTFQWLNTNTDIGLVASGTGPLSFNAASAGTTTIIVTPSTNGCEGDPVTFTLQVQSGTPNPVSLNLTLDTLCKADAAQMVTGMPVGGTLSGPGTNSIPSFFTPVEAGVGTHILAYTYGDDGCTSTATDTVVVLPEPVVQLPEKQIICADHAATLSVTGTPNATIWYRENGTDRSLVLDGSGHETLTWPSLTENIQIHWDSIGFAGSARCVEVLDEFTTVEVAPEISGPAVEVMGTACPGGQLMLNLSGEADLQVVYQLMGEEPDSLILPSDGDTIMVLAGLTETSSLALLRARRSDLANCTLDLSGESIELPVWEAPQLANVPNTFLCSGETFELDLTSLVLNDVPVTFAWEVVSETPNTGAMDGSGNQIRQVLENKTGETISLLYRVTVTPDEGDCSGSTLLVPVQVFSEPVAALSVLDQTLCPADTLQPIQITVTNDMTAQTHLSWERNGLTEVSGAANGTGNQISGLLTNLTQTDQMVTYSVYQEATNGCTGDTLTSIVRLPIDETAPVAVCPPLVRIAVNRVTGVRMYGHEIDAGSSDNCGIYEYGLSMDSVGWNERGTHEVTLTVRDISGNSDNCTFPLEVTEEQACRAQLNVVLDENGQYELQPQQVITGVMAPGLRIQVDDSQPGNGAIVDCPGEYRYAIFDESDALVCWGYVLAEDKSAPTVVGLTDKKDSLICTYVDQLANNAATIDPADRYYLGHITFTDNTADCPDCTLPETTFTDRVEYLDCPADLAFGAEYVYARMYRTFVQKDCHGNERDTMVIYNFIKPTISDFRSPISLAAGASAEESDFEIFSCNPANVTIPDTLGLPYLISVFGDTLTLADIDCKYAWSVEDQTFPICEGRGLKVERTIRVMDWCAGESGTPFDTVLIKIGDFAAPQLNGPITDLRISPYSDPLDFLAWYDTVYLQQEIVPGLDTWPELVDYAREQGTLSIISTGPADCTGALLLEQDWIEQQFGVSVSDNCELREVGYELLRYGPENKDQEITGDYLWRSTDYQLQGNAITGLPTGIYALAITGRDYCGLSSTGLIIFTVEDQIAPVMTCDDQVTVTLSQEALAKIVPADLEEGSWDSCGPVSLALRQKNTDTLWQQELWLDCSQVGGPIVVEVQGIDAAGNTNTCWTEVVVEDKTAPLCTDLTPLTLTCDDPGLEDLRSLGLPETPFSNCGNIEILEPEAITNLDQCGVGTITRQFVAVKDQGAETEQRSEICEQLIEVVPHHDYWLMFPTDQTAACGEDVSIRGVAFAENACDLIAISHTDERFYATQDPEACYKIFRTYRVINWCEYDGESAPTIVSRDWDGWNGQNPRHPDGDDVPGDEDMYVIVKRNLADGHPDTVFYDNNPYPHDASIQQDGITYDHWWAVLSGNNDPATEDYYEGIPEHVPGCTDCHSTWSYDGDQTDSDIAGNVQGDDSDFRYGSFGYWQYTQHIIVYDTIAPALTINGVDSFCSISDEDCSASVELTIAATDLCTDDQGDVTVSVGLDMHNDGTLDQDVTAHFDPATGLFSGRYPLGEHRLVVTVNDGCGNQAMGDYVFTVVDCKAPAPIVIDALSVELMPSDSDSTGAAAVVWADDFVASTVYDCNGQDATQTDANGNSLVTRYSINRVGKTPDPTQDHLYLNCTEAVRTLEVEIHTWDEAGNHDFATTFLLVQDNMELCEEPADGAGGITGAIATEHHLPVPNVEVRLSGSAQRSYLTDQRGGYSLFGLKEGGDYTVTPGLNDDPLNGVSTFDLVLISKHILGLQPFESPYQQIAADINRSGTVTTLDLIQLRKLILHIDAEFRNNTSWRFVDADYGFRQNSNPLDEPFPEVKNINNLEGEEVAEFVAIKVGDVNGNANVAELRSFAGTFHLNVAEQELKAGNEYRIPVTTEQLHSVLGYQFTLEVDPSVAEIIDVESGIATDEHFGVFTAKGIITTSWNSHSALSIQHSTLFTLVLRPTADTKVSDVLRISSKYTAAEAYNTASDLLGVALNVNGATATAANELLQNNPNPFKGETVIGFNLIDASGATITVQDVTGRILKVVEGDFAAGYNQVRLTATDLPSTGVFYYTLQAGEYTATKKMILVE